MNFLSNHIVDCLVLVTILLSGILAFARGFVRECLALIAWILALFAAMHFSEGMKAFLAPYIHKPEALDAAAKVSIFVTVLVVLSIVSYFIARMVRTSALSAVDRSLGFLFGAARGFLIVCLVYLLGTLIFPVDVGNNKTGDQPDWLKGAKTQPFLAAGGSWLESFIPPDEARKWRDELGTTEDAADKLAAQHMTAPLVIVKTGNATTNTTTSTTTTASGPGVAADDGVGALTRRQLDQTHLQPIAPEQPGVTATAPAQSQ